MRKVTMGTFWINTETFENCGMTDYISTRNVDYMLSFRCVLRGQTTESQT